MAPPVPLPGGKLEELIEALAREPSPLRRRQVLLGARALWSPETAIRLADETVRRMYVDIPQAERMARSANWLAGQVASPKARAAGLRAMGHIQERKRRYQAALTDFDQAREILEGLGEELEIGRTLNSSLHCLMYLGRYEEALAAAGRAAEIFQRLGDRRAAGPGAGQHGQHHASPGPFRGGTGPGPPRLCRVNRVRRAARRGGDAAEHGHLPDRHERFPRGAGDLRAGAQLLHGPRTCRCCWRWPITTSPICTTCAANTRAPSPPTAPRASTAASWGTPIARRCATWTSPKCTWS